MKISPNEKNYVYSISIYVHYDLDLTDLLNQKGHPLIMVNMSAKFDKEAHNRLF